MDLLKQVIFDNEVYKQLSKGDKILLKPYRYLKKTGGSYKNVREQVYFEYDLLAIRELLREVYLSNL